MLDKIRGSRMLVLLVGTIAIAFMAQQFAFFVPIVFAAWVLARLGYAPRFLGARHDSVRLVGGTQGPGWALAEVHVETEQDAPERAVAALREVFDLAIARLGAPQDGSGVVDSSRIGTLLDALVRRGESLRLTWPAEGQAAAPADAEWADLAREIVEGRARLLLEAHPLAGRSLRVRLSLVAPRELLQDLLASAALSMRRRGLEAITTGWLRTAEREAVIRHRRAVRRT